MEAESARRMAEKKSLLVVDDDIALLRMVERLLSESYAVSLARSGKSALQLFETGFVPDAILLDIDMPDMDGFETLSALQALPSLDDVPVLLLTGFTGPVAERAGLRSGAWDYITKPFDREVLLLRLERQIGNAEERRAAKALRRASRTLGWDEVKFAGLTATLTPTEQSVARRIAQGYSNHEICEELHYSYSYVKKVACIVFEKMQVSKRGELRKLFQ